MNSMSRALAILDLFSRDRMTWTADQIREQLNYTHATAYRYIRELLGAGLLLRFGDGRYVLGPRVVELDTLLREADPLIAAGAPVTRELAAQSGFDFNLMEFYGDRIVTIHRQGGDRQLNLAYGRGRSFPLLRGAPAKVIVAHLPRTRLDRIYRENAEDARIFCSAKDVGEFRSYMAEVRKAGHLMTAGEVDPGFSGVAVPIFTPDGAILGCIAAAMTDDRMALTRVERLVELMQLSAGQITTTMADLNSDNIGSA